MTDTNSLFDYAESQKRKEEGIEQAARNQPDLLELARSIAKKIALDGDRTCHADRVGRVLKGMNITPGPWLGALFKGGDWEFTGQRKRSARKSNHGRELKIWRLK